MTRIAALAVLLMAAADVLSADPPAGGGLAYTPPVPPAPPDVGTLVVKLFVLTALMVGLCVGVVWAVRRSGRVRAARVGDAGRLRHEGSLVLDRRCAVHLIQADGQTVAVTTDATGLRSLVVLSDPFDAALDEAGAAPAGTSQPDRA